MNKFCSQLIYPNGLADSQVYPFFSFKTASKKNELDFTVLSDPHLTVARKFGIVYQLPQETDELYKSHGLDVAKHNEMERAELPLSATYVVNQKGEIVYAFLEPDYKKRAAPETIIETLSKIKSATARKP